MDHGADMEPTLNRFPNGNAAGVSRRAGDQCFAGHLVSCLSRAAPSPATPRSGFSVERRRPTRASAAVTPPSGLGDRPGDRPTLSTNSGHTAAATAEVKSALFLTM